MIKNERHRYLKILTTENYIFNMKQTQFYLVVRNTSGVFRYVAGFKNKSDAESYVNTYGGVIEPIECIFYSSFEEAKTHHDTVKSFTNHTLSNFLAMSDEDKILFKHHHPEIIEQLKQLI